MMFLFFVLGLFAVYLAYYLLCVAGRARIVHRACNQPREQWSEYHRYIEARCPTLYATYYPFFFAPFAFAQIFCLQAFSRTLKLEHFEREIVTMKDGGSVALDWFLGLGVKQEIDKERPIMLVLHGLTGGSVNDSTVATIIPHAARNGFQVVVYNRRGHGGSRLSSPTLTAFGDTSDLRQVVSKLATESQGPICAVGFSAGSGLLAKYIGEEGEKDNELNPLAAAVAVSPGYELRKVIHDATPVINKLITYALKRFLRNHIDQLSEKIDIDQALKCSSWAEFDANVHVKLGGHSSLEDYYKANDPMNNSKTIRTRFLAFNSEDDPVCPARYTPYSMFEQHETGIVAVTQFGSHCSYFEKFGLSPTWAARAATEFCHAVIDYDASHR